MTSRRRLTNKVDPKVLSHNLREVRIRKGLKQAQVADAVGMTRAGYHYIELGATLPSAQSLSKIAKVLGVRLKDLSKPIDPLKAVRFRVHKRMRDREVLLAKVGCWLKDYGELETALQQEIPWKLGAVSQKIRKLPKNDERPEKAALLARQALGLADDEPVSDIVGLMESAGIKVLPLRTATDSFYGMSVSPKEGGPAIAVNIWEPITVERCIFATAHELGHLLLHPETYDVGEAEEDDTMDEEADRFAMNFLMPSDLVMKRWEETAGLGMVERVLRTKRLLRVGYRMLLRRLQELLGVKEDMVELFLVHYRKRMGRGALPAIKGLKTRRQPASLKPRRTNEPARLSMWDYVPVRLSSLVQQAVKDGHITRQRGEGILVIDQERLRRLTAADEA